MMRSSVSSLSGCAPGKPQSFFQYDASIDQWIPTSGPTSPIPVRLEDCSERVKTCMKERSSGSWLQMAGNDVYVDSEGYLRGPECVSDVKFCKQCGGGVEEAVDGTDIVIRTCIGAVKRLVRSCACTGCGLKFEWQAAAEGIHMIQGGREGGEMSSFSFPLQS
jgi:hypothetical protein